MRGRGRDEHADIEAVAGPSGTGSLIKTRADIMPVLGPIRN
jgi:hypothetical protein